MDTITTIATVPAIVALVNLGKSLGINGKASALLAVLLGVGLNYSTFAWGGTGWFEAVSQGLILGLGAAGLYDLTPDGGETEADALLADAATDIEAAIYEDSGEPVAGDVTKGKHSLPDDAEVIGHDSTE